MRVLLPWKSPNQPEDAQPPHSPTSGGGSDSDSTSTSSSPKSRSGAQRPSAKKRRASNPVAIEAAAASSRKRRSSGGNSSSALASPACTSSELDSKPAARRTAANSAAANMTAGDIGKHQTDDDDDREGWPASAASSATPPLVQYREMYPRGGPEDPELLENEPHTGYQMQMAAAVAGSTLAAASARRRSCSPGGGDDAWSSSPTDIPSFAPPTDDDSAFARGLKKRGLEIAEQEGDGNCLFRAVALQVYGDASAHAEVRQLCCDFMARDPDHFGEFVDEDFADYIARKRQDGVHGNNPELQALCELFNRPLEVYTPESGPDRPINIFHGEYKTSDVPIRLSYHDGNHYNAVVNPILPTAGLGLGLPGLQPGLADKLQVAQAVADSDRLEDERELQRAVKESRQEYQLATDDALQRAIKESAYSADHMYQKKALALSDLDATNFELEQTVLVDSLLVLQQEQGRKQRAHEDGPSFSVTSLSRPRGRGGSTAEHPSSSAEDLPVPADASLVPTVASAVAVAAASAASLDSAPAVATAAASAKWDPGDHPALSDTAEYPETVQELVMNGFELHRVVRAYELVGDNFDDLLSFLMSQQQP